MIGIDYGEIEPGSLKFDLSELNDEIAELDPRPTAWQRMNRWRRAGRGWNAPLVREDSSVPDPLPDLYIRHRDLVEAKLIMLAVLHRADLKTLREDFLEFLWNGPERMRSAVFVMARASASWWMSHLQAKRERGKPITLEEKRWLVRFWHGVYPELGPDALAAQLDNLVDRKFVAHELKRLKIVGLCHDCGAPLTGRSDRKYCDDTCRKRDQRRTDRMFDRGKGARA